MKKSAVIFLLVLIIQILASCESAVKKEEPETITSFSSDIFHTAAEAPQCKSMLDYYCNYLYSPVAGGNLEIKRSMATTRILQGETPNQFSQVFYSYSKAKLQNRDLLPKDFQRVLNRHSYFPKLEGFLQRKPIPKMNLSERLIIEQQDFELGSIWSAAFNETVILRMSKKFPGFHTLPEKLIPLEISLEQSRVRRLLITEISKAIWSGNDNWRQVEMTFDKLKLSYLKLIQRLDAPDSLKANWAQRIKDVQLALPGSLPAISNEECSTVKANAYYYTYLNVITVCAGDFNSEDILQTLAHEMGHSLDIDRTAYLFETNSEMGKQVRDLRAQVCKAEKFSCEKWNEFQGKFSDSLSSLDGFQPDLPEFQRCLKRRPTSKALTGEDIKRFSSSMASDRVSQLATSDRFLRITKERIPMPDGSTQKNPNYLNPCSYYLWSQGEEPVNDELTTLMFFTAAYRCSAEAPAQKMRSSIEVAKNMTRQIIEKTLAIEGEFSGLNELESGGYSSPPGERFADVIGSYAMADFLTQLPFQWDRRNKFLAGASWLCSEPSLASHYPDESSAEKEFAFSAHTEGDQRRKELFSQPIREVIGCEKDFQFNECKLPVK
ncbi:MAG: hypothetical protein JSU04_07145 [Bdellovibrionales bacterium]|nr:hypothetical protein [Bdellovibrionales bacterium]